VERLGRTVISDLAGGVDARIGGVIERANRNHHLRRLARIDWGQAFRGEGQGWASRRPPREGNDSRCMWTVPRRFQLSQPRCAALDRLSTLLDGRSPLTSLSSARRR